MGTRRTSATSAMVSSSSPACGPCDLLRDGAHADSPCIGADQGFTVGGVGLLSPPNAAHDRVGWPTMRWTITAWYQVRATPRFRLIIMGLERPLIRTPRHVPPRGCVGLCAGQATYPRMLWAPPCQGQFGGFSGDQTREGTFRNVAHPSSAGWLSRSVFNAHVLFNAHVFILRTYSVTNPLVLVVLTQREIPWSAPLRCRSR